MPNGNHEKKEYGPHEYAKNGTSNCKYKCGCWAGDCNSGGPVGLDPIGGRCPANPLDGKPLGGNRDHEYVVTERINTLHTNLSTARDRIKELEDAAIPSKTALAKKVRVLEEGLQKAEQKLREVKEIISPKKKKRW